MDLNPTQRDNIEQLLKQLPPSSQNNERSYWRRKLVSFYDKPSISKAREIEDRFEGISIDLDDDGSNQGIERGQKQF